MPCYLNTDGGSRGNPGPAGCGFVLVDDQGTTLASAGWYLGEQTNNHAEYCALIWGLENARAAKVSDLVVRADSELMVKQMNGLYKVKNEALKSLYARARLLCESFDSVCFEHVYREANAEADARANEAMDVKDCTGSFLVDFDGRPRDASGTEPLFDIDADSPRQDEQEPAAVPEDDSTPGVDERRPLVLVGITGCIAAYKACEVVRGLQKRNVDVKVVMTEHACEFIGPTTFRALTGHEVAVGLFDEPGAPIHHISLAKEPDLFAIVPATANVLAKIANGCADDLLTTTVLATKAPLVVAPAMNVQMWEDEATKCNIKTLAARGITIVGPASGYQACGDEGTGRLEEPAAIVDAILTRLSAAHDLVGKRVLITAGPTQEPIDPVRYLSNGSSGITGYALAAEAVARGAQVTLVSGPVALDAPEGCELVRVRTAEQMLEACREPFSRADVAIFVAAVSDWRPEKASETKLKHDEGALEVTFVPNPDIAATLGAEKGSTYTVAFAAETGNPIDAARKKLVSKNADMVVANDVSSPELGMGSADNHVWFVEDDGVTELETAPKCVIARQIFDHVVPKL